jgi:hypothetical protein
MTSMSNDSMTRRGIIGLAAIACCGTLVHADTFHWTGATGGNWTDAGKWTPSGVPGAVSPLGSPPAPNGDVAIFDATGNAYTVTSDARNVHELQLNSPNLTLNYPIDAGLRTDQLVFTAAKVARVTLNNNGQVSIPSPQTVSGFVDVRTMGSASVLSNDIPASVNLIIGSGPESAGTSAVLTLPTGPLSVAGVPSIATRVSYVGLSPTNNLPAGIDVGGGALYVPGGGIGALVFNGPALANPHYVNGSLYHRGNALFHVDTRVENGVFLQGGSIQMSAGKVLSTPTLHFGQPGDAASTQTGGISGNGTVALTQSGEVAELDYGTASFQGTLNAGAHLHSTTTLYFNGTLNGNVQVDSSAKLGLGGTVNGNLHLASATTLTPYDQTALTRVNGTLTADANALIEISATASAYSRVVADQFVGSTKLRLVDTSQESPEPGFYRGVLEMINGDLPAGFVAGIQYNPQWAGLTVTPQIDPIDAGMLNLTLTGTPGDADLDGFINFNDLIRVAKNYGNLNTSWSRGNFDNDGVTGFSDLVVLAQRYNTHVLTTDGLPADFAADWALAQSLVPEPTAALALASGALLVRRRVRRAAAW